VRTDIPLEGEHHVGAGRIAVRAAFDGCRQHPHGEAAAVPQPLIERDALLLMYPSVHA
jgi:hypothetical protein